MQDPVQSTGYTWIQRAFWLVRLSAGKIWHKCCDGNKPKEEKSALERLRRPPGWLVIEVLNGKQWLFR